MKELLAVMAVLALSIFAGCGSGGKYGDLRKAMNDTIEAQESFAAAIEKAKSGQEVASAIDKFSADMGEIKALRKELLKKYPEVSLDGEGPAELKDLYGREMAAAEKMVKASTAIMFKYADDPDVRKAATRLGGALQ
jgi:hypothetical protein